MSILKVNTIQDKGGNTIISSDGSGTFTPNGFGKIGQVLQAYKTDAFTTTSSGLNDITGLSVSITPSSTSSKVLVTSFVSGFSHSGRGGGFRLVRDSTSIGLADSAGSRTLSSFSGHLYTGDASGTEQMHFNAQAMYLDSPSTTSATTYKVQYNGTGANLYINRQETDTDNNDYTRCVSHITVMEVLA
jgi:hypothetical protein